MELGYDYDPIKTRTGIKLRKPVPISERKLRRENVIDPLTEMLNRRGLEKESKPTLGRKRKFGCIILDIDRFKDVNDTYGHPAGDKVITDTARIINEHIRNVDIACRLGGEEFLIILPDIYRKRNLKEIAERLRASMEKALVIVDNKKIKRTASFGISIGIGYKDFEKAFNKSDKALYVAKKSGRNRVEVYNE